MTEVSRWSAWSDRLNPILVREITQALKGRAFIILLSLALASIVVTTLVVAAEGVNQAGAGRDYFVVALTLLTPIAIVLVPIQAFQSMQAELKGGAGEQLLMSDLSPAKIVRGKITAAMVQVFLFLSVFGPMLAMTFLLRGVDVATIGFFLVMTLACSLVATSFAVAMGSLTRAKILSSLLFAGTASALGFSAVGLMAGMEEITREISSLLQDNDFWIGIGITLTAFAVAIGLFSMIARSLLTHPYENKSTQFRVLAIVGIVVAVIWIVSAAPMRHWGDAGLALAMGSPMVLVVFWLFAVTEEERLSIRVKTMVPRSRGLAWLVAPFLPGGGRGSLFMVVTAIFTILLATILHALSPTTRSPRMIEGAVASWCYAFFYAGLGRIVRSRLPVGPQGTWIARLLTPILLILGCVIPIFLELMMRGHVGSWSPLHATNPFWSMDRISRVDDVVPIIAIGAFVVMLLNVPAMTSGLTEVLQASDTRRRREQKVDAS